ncbi:MAG: methionyl-tRNA formyltransferase [Treponema sp.]|nr:methionyl-tRNA formyltransferase [Treponema sp.]
MRVLFAGSAGIAVPSLIAVSELKEIDLCGVLTNPDTPKGRHGTPVPTEIGEAAEAQRTQREELLLIKPAKLDAAAREQIAALRPDLLVSFAYGRLFGPKFMALFPLGGINIHPSLLPKYRGPSPIQAAILNRDTITGVSIQTLAQEMDSGDILAVEQFELTGSETSDSLSNTAARIASEMLPETLLKIAAGKIETKAQEHENATYCKLIQKNDGIIDWSLSAAQIDAKIRAFNPWPLCRTFHNGKELLILKADVYRGYMDAALSSERKPGMVLGIDKQCGILIQTGDGVLIVSELQYQAKKALFWRDFLNGARDFPGSQL